MRTSIRRRAVGAGVVAGLSGALLATVAPAASAVPNPDLTIGLANIAEGNARNAPVYFSVRLSEPGDAPVSATYTVVAGSAGADDLGLATGRITIPTGGVVTRIPVYVSGDTAVEGDETFEVRLSGVTGARLVTPAAPGVIINDDSSGNPNLTVSDNGVFEGDARSGAVYFTVRLSAPSPTPVTFSYRTFDGSGSVAGGDYRPESGSLTIPAGRTSTKVTVRTRTDAVPEPDETFGLNVTSSVAVLRPNGTGVIHNDD